MSAGPWLEETFAGEELDPRLAWHCPPPSWRLGAQGLCLSTAAGTDLQQSVDLVTSVLGVFDLQSSETAKVADVMTSALNESKLTIDKLALGFQYAGNLAAQNGVNFQELTALLGALSNSGIRSGSTLGSISCHCFSQ